MRLSSADGFIQLFVRSVEWNEKKTPKRCTMICTPWAGRWKMRSELALKNRWILFDTNKDPQYLDLLTVELEHHEVAEKRAERIQPFVERESHYILELKEIPNKVSLETLKKLGLSMFVPQSYVKRQENKKQLIIDTD